MRTTHRSHSVIRRQSGSEIHRYTRVIIAASLLLMLANSLIGQDKLIDEQVISKWKAYEVFSRNLQGTARTTKTFDSGKTVRYQSSFKQNKDCVLCASDMKTADQPDSDQCLIANPRYAAKLNRSKTNPTQAVLEDFTNDPYVIFGDYSMSSFQWTFLQTSPHFAAAGKPLYELLADPVYKDQKVSKLVNNGREFVRLDYKYKTDPDKSKRGPFGHGQGWLLLDPSRCWCVVRSNSLGRRFNENGEPIIVAEHDTQFELFDHPSGFPLVKSQTKHTTFHMLQRSKKQAFQTVTEYKWEVDDRVPDSEFTLSAFGLPEPGSDTVQKSTPLYLWILLGAAGCALLAVLFRYLARRRSRDMAAT